jgi:Bacterial TSP3 repeat/Carboxypeptidase regulatory-like domain/Bacterial Ig-like domain (group 2)
MVSMSDRSASQLEAMSAESKRARDFADCGGVRRQRRFAAAALLFGGALALSPGRGFEAAAQQYATAGCTATIENRAGFVDLDGTFAIPNVPLVPGQYLVHIACPQPDGSLLGAVSTYIDFTSGASFSLPPLPLGVPQPEAQSLSVQPVSGILSAVGATVQLAVIGTLPNGGPVDATLGSEGTTYISSNALVATVDANGLVTARGPGSVTIAATNDGLSATVILNSFASLDSDGDGMPDTWEIANGLNPFDPTDAGLDPDGDGLTNLQEYQLGTNPHVYDTDGDGLSDGQEVALGTNPLVADTDGDGLSDGQEVALGTNPLVADTDGDGIPDGIEVKIGTNPLVADVTTTVSGYVTNADGSPHPGASVVVLTYFTGVTDTTGAFTLLHVPVTLGNIIATAEAIVGTTVYSGSSQSIAAVGNGSTNVGTIQLGQNGGQVSGTVTTPDNKADPGVLITVTGGADTRSAVTDGSGLFSVGGLKVGPVSVAALDPTTSLRGQAGGTLGVGAPLTLNIKLAAYGTVSGNVTNAAGNSVGAGVTVTLSGTSSGLTTTDSLGHYSFAFVPLGIATVDATDANANHGHATGSITATSQTINENIQYLGKGTVTGTVSDGTGTPVAGAVVQLTNDGAFYQSLSTTTNSIGQYTIPGVFVGTLRLSATFALSSTGGTANSAITRDGQTVTANISLLPTGTISGTVYRSDGTTKVSGAAVTLNFTAYSTVTNSAGAFTIANVPLGGYTATAVDSSTGDRGKANVALSVAGNTVPVTINMLGLGTVNVTVLDGGGNPSGGAIVQLSATGAFTQNQGGVTAVDGTVSFTQQLAGGLSVFATAPATGLTGRATATLAAGQTAAVTVTLQSAGSVQGTVHQLNGTTPVAGATIQLDGVAATQTGADGKYVIAVVPSGTHQVFVLDSAGNTLAFTTGVTISTQGQVVTANFVIVGRGTVTGQVTNPDGSPSQGAAVEILSSAPGFSNYLTGSTDVNGNYTVPNVAVGSYSAIAQLHTATINSYGTATGAMPSDGGSAVTNIQLSSLLVPAAVQLNDANGFGYPIRPNGGLFDGTFSVFAGDSAGNEGGSLLSLVQNGNATPFSGAQFAQSDLSARQISVVQNGIDGLNVTRRVYVPQDGYFARYLELISNPGAQNITVDVTLTTNLRLIIQKLSLGGTIFHTNNLAQIIKTSSGDSTLNIADPNTPDHWVTLSGPNDQDPFNFDSLAETPIPSIADVFDGPGGKLSPTSAGYVQDPNGNFSTLTETFGSVTVPAGGTVGILHFLSQENLYESANASAGRLVQLPPEALAGLTEIDRSAISNFVVPAGGTSTLAALPALTNQVSGVVYAWDGTTLMPFSSVFVQSTDPIFARTYTRQVGVDAAYSFQGVAGGISLTPENFNVYAYSGGTATPVTVQCAQTGQEAAGGCAILSPTAAGSFAQGATSATQDIVFSNTGILTGTVSRGPTVLNVSGTITLNGGPMNSLTVPIQADGSYRIPGVLPGNYNVLAQVTNTLLTGLTTTTITAGQTTVTNVTIGEAGNITGSVKRGDGTLAVTDTVYLRVPGQAGLAVIVDTAGHYAFTDIPIGSYEVDCFDPLTNSAASATVAVTTNATTIQNLSLQSFGTVTGNVTANDGSSVANLTVTLTSTTTNGVQNLTTTTNATGGFTFGNVSPGTVVLHTTNAAGLQGGGSGGLPLAGQTVNINIALIAAGNLTGTVFQGDGTTPAAGIQVTLVPAPLTGGAVTTTNANGVYSYQNVGFGGFTVFASNTATGDLGQANSQIQINGQLRTVNVTLNGFGNLTVKVFDASSNPIANAAVSVTSQNIGTRYTGTSDATGTAQFNNIFAGPVFVTARSPITGFSAQASATLAYHASQTVTVTLQAFGTIQGTVYAPDGVTPVAGATVQLFQGLVATTNSSGAYQFLNQPLEYYNFTVRDAAGIARATANFIQLQHNGDTLTQNFTMVGVAGISGLVKNVDGTPAENVSLTVTSKNTTLGGAQNISTGGDGTYSVAELPVGGFTVSVNNLPSNLSGYVSSAVVTNGVNVVANIQIISSTVTLPLTLTDADNFSYTIAGSGDYGVTGQLGGLNPFFDAQTLNLNIGGAVYSFGSGGAPVTSIQSLNGQQVELTQVGAGGLNVTRKIYVPSDGYFSRRMEVLQNSTSAPITVTLKEGGSIERYSQYSPQVVTTSNGNATVDGTILWAVDNDDSGTNPYPQTQPALANVFAGAGAPTGMANVAVSYTTQQFRFGQSVYYTSQFWTYTYTPVTIPANSSVSFLFFTAQESTSSTATTAAQRLEQLPAEALAGLSSSDLASVVNFVVPAVQTLPALTPPATNTLQGTVYAGDGTTIIPNATVYVQSTDLEYGFGTSTTAGPDGVYVIPALVASSYAAEAVDPASGATSTTTTGTVPSNLVNGTQDIIFTNTGILQGLVQATGAGSFVGGTAYLDLPCSNGVLYCSQSPAKFGPSGAFTILTALAGNDGISANVVTAQGGNIPIPTNYGYYNLTIPAQQTTQFTLTMPSTGNISGTVKNADGTPAAGVTVNAYALTLGLALSTTTDANGGYLFTSIVTDTYTVYAVDPITAGRVSQNVTISQDATGIANLTFIGHGTVVATVHYANGNLATGNVQLAISTVTAPGYTYAFNYTDSSGQYTFSNVPTGPYTIHAFYPGQNFYSTTNATMTGNGQTQQTAVTLTPVGTISGTVTFANGTAATSSYVTANDALGIFGAAAQTDSAGNYGIFPVPTDRVINVRSSNPNNFQSDSAAYANNLQIPGDGQTLTVNLRYPGQANVKVTVLQSNGTPYTNTPGNVILHSADGFQSYNVTLGADGTATFNNVYEASFVAYAYVNYTSYPAGSKLFTVKSTDDGTTVQVTINTSPTGSVQGNVFASDGVTPILNNFNVILKDIDTGTTNGASTNGGSYNFTGVQVGASGFTLTPQFGNTTYTALAATGNITTQGQVVTQNFTLPVSSVSGTVFLDDGITPVPYASVSGSETSNTGQQTFVGAIADVNGQYQLVGALTGTLNESGYDSNSVVGKATVTLTSDTQIITGANITLGATGMVIGTIYDSNHLAVPNLDFELNSSGNNGGFSNFLTTDSQGNYQATDVPVGNIVVTTTLPDGTTASGSGVLNNNGDTITVDIGTPPAPLGAVFGTVYDSIQDPNPGATVTLTAASPSTIVVTATTDQNGMYTAPGLPIGMVSATALLNDGVTTVGPVTGNVPDFVTPVEIDLGLDNPGNVSGIVYDMNMDPIPGVNVLVSSSGDTSTGFSESTAADGSFFFGGVAPGTVSIIIQDSNGTTIGTATGTLPYGGNVVINVTTNTVGATLNVPAIGRKKQEPVMASVQPPWLRPGSANRTPLRAAKGTSAASLAGEPVIISLSMVPPPIAAQGAHR